MKKFIAGLIIVAIAGIVGFTYRDQISQAAGTTLLQSAPTLVSASSTVYTVTTSSQRIMASSSPKRIAATVQPINCTGNGPVFLTANRDVAATVNSGIAVYASTTMAFGDYPELPAVQGSVTAIAQTGTCTVLVTQWVSQY